MHTITSIQFEKLSHIYRHLIYSSIVAIVIFTFFKPLHELALLSLSNQLYSHFLLIPLVSLFFMLADQKLIFKCVLWSPVAGLVVIVFSIIVYVSSIQFQAVLNQNDYLSLCVLGAVTCLHGGFIFVYGSRAYRAALFPLYFLIFCIPIPNFILNFILLFLQKWSAHAVQWLFDLVNLPYFREGMTFQLPGVAIEVAKECSGIRSSLALFITGILAGRLFFKTMARKILIVTAVIPLTIIKNAIRICTLSLLAVHIDKSWLTNSWLHQGGGIVFFLIALIIMAPFVCYLIYSEKKSRRG